MTLSDKANQKIALGLLFFQSACLLWAALSVLSLLKATIEYGNLPLPETSIQWMAILLIYICFPPICLIMLSKFAVWAFVGASKNIHAKRLVSIALFLFVAALSAAKKWDYYPQQLEDAYHQYYDGKSVKQRLTAMDRIFFYQAQLLKYYHYKPVDILNSCASCSDKYLTALPISAHYTTPQYLPAKTINYLKALGVFDMVVSQVDHIFFIDDKAAYPELTSSNALATGDTLTKTVIFTQPISNVVDPILPAIIAHEAFHLKNNNNYNSYPESEKDAFAFENNLLQETLRIFSAELTEQEKSSIRKRVQILNDRFPGMAKKCERGISG